MSFLDTEGPFLEYLLQIQINIVRIVKSSHKAELRFANTCENTTKKQLYQVKKEKVEIILELEKTRLRVADSATYCNQ